MDRSAVTPPSRLAQMRAAIGADGWALLPLRLLVGYGFAVHGYAKLARGPAAFAEILAAIGVPAALPTAWITSLLELLGGISKPSERDGSTQPFLRLPAQGLLPDARGQTTDAGAVAGSTGPRMSR